MGCKKAASVKVWYYINSASSVQKYCVVKINSREIDGIIGMIGQRNQNNSGPEWVQKTADKSAINIVQNNLSLMSNPNSQNFIP